MKTSKSPENTEITPSKKKLKQARLPFKLISEAPVSPVTPQTRKRKLSAAEAESAPKVGKICKENDVVEDVVTISDDETSHTKETVKNEKPLNPFVKLVDTAWKKKIQKSKKKKSDKKKSSQHKDSENTPTQTKEEEGNDSKNEDAPMEVDLVPVIDSSRTCNGNVASNENTSKNGTNGSPKSKKTSRKSARNSKVSAVSSKSDIEDKLKGEAVSESTVLEDSNKSDEVKSNYIFEPTINSEVSSSNKTAEKNTNETFLEVNNSSKCNDSDETGNDTLNSPKKDIKTEVKLNNPITTIEPTKDLETDKLEQETAEGASPMTAKRSTRNKAKLDEKTLSKPKRDESVTSVTSNPGTPKHNRSLSVTTSLDDSLNESNLSTANLTPKQLQKKLEAAKKREEREKEKEEREKKKQQEKEEKAKQRLEKEEQKKKEREEKEEQKRKEREEKEEQKRKEKEEKDRQRELEKKQREEKEDQKRKEREEKEEQRRKEKEARDEEKRKKQEAQELEKQEQELKKKKAAEAFVNFFVPKQKSDKDQHALGTISKSSVLSSFAIKNDMRLAPTVRVDLTEEKKHKLDNLMEEQNVSESALYIRNLKDGSTKPLSSGKTWPLSERDDDVMIIEDELPPLDGGGEIITCDPLIREKLRPKLLSFHDNRRPPYWGTWRKKSVAIKPRNPFGQDGKQLDYEVDSDEEWEEEQEGESIDGSAAGSDDEQDADEYEVDNEVFVPHGYLSDEEATMDDDDVLSLSPETQKARLKHLEDEFETEMKKPTEKLKPRLYGILWETNEGGKPEHCVDALWNYFGKLSMIMNDPTPFLQLSSEPEEIEKKKVKKKKVASEGDKQSPKSDKKKRAKMENKEIKVKSDTKNNTPEIKKNQPGINSFLKKVKNNT
ncbi:unnamed protein product [Chilo suppressalis]|uniref:Chromatin assembly factor 1 subunit p150 C-terminal domain-containing protein n=1 Tax=Chilo suppressalis TaxID=168631 RepID=A0ABN8AU08_CHISP|nr:unnamed protein product [Chilo suppressalis]